MSKKHTVVLVVGYTGLNMKSLLTSALNDGGEKGSVDSNAPAKKTLSELPSYFIDDGASAYKKSKLH